MAINDNDSRRQFAWLDTRGCGDSEARAYIEAALHLGIAGIVSADLTVLAALPPTATRVWFPADSSAASAGAGGADVVILPESAPPFDGHSSADTGYFITVADADSLATTTDLARRAAWTIVKFADPTKIPLEIVLAAADNAAGKIVTVVSDLEEAAVTLGCLEHGADGVLMAPDTIDDIAALAELVNGTGAGELPLTEFSVEAITHLGMGDRSCLDTCSMLRKDEGLLVGSFANALLLTCSETHPLPYMPTRPWRVNAGAVHSYTLTSPTRTNYLSELTAGHQAVAVGADGRTRVVALGRVKTERRPLLSIDAVSADGTRANIVVQDDWHVRLLGPGARVHNVTELQAGDVLLGFVPGVARHVGWPVTEFCVER